MNILCIGDVCGDAGCDFLRQVLPGLKKLKGIDLVIANGENSAPSNGITPQSAEHLLASGVDVITGGNHSFRRKEIYPLLEQSDRILRPANYPASVPGSGFTIVDCGYAQVAVINLLGVVFMESLACPFETADRLIQRAKSEGANIIMVDFHAEATSEKRAFGFYLDSRVSAVFGTHTHVQTADEQILPKGTGYITDLGMTGPIQSVLGVNPETIITKFKDKMPVRFDFAKGDCMLSGCIFTIDRNTGLTVEVERINIT
ncbi:MAG TPA: TIGR00282 family metallophosphoesterase [Clostridiales bacterium]|nr:TIGR00282 family metallophosphoesterase [Clostridiales bacterium]